MKVTEFTRGTLTVRREHRRMTALGYHKHETDWEIHRGLGATDQVILDAKISTDGKYVWTKVGLPPHIEHALSYRIVANDAVEIIR